MKAAAASLGAFALCLALSPAAFPCSAFHAQANGSNLLAMSFDFGYGHGMLIANQRGLRKKALVQSPVHAEWTAKYGSLTFDQAGRELPYGGINEKGLAIEALWLGTAKFPEAGRTPAVSELQWMQYQLDRFADVAEVLSHLSEIAIVKKVATIHYVLCDAGGACATAEPIEGKLVVHQGAELPIPALTNRPYEGCVQFAEPILSQGSPLPADDSSFARFTRVGHAAQTFGRTGADPIWTAFAGLSSVYNDTNDDGDFPTQWDIVYDLDKKLVYYRTRLSPKEKLVDLSRLDFACGPAVKALDVNDPRVGDLTPFFSKFTPADNRKLVGQSLEKGFAKLPKESADKIARYPETAVCAKSAQD